MIAWPGSKREATITWSSRSRFPSCSLDWRQSPGVRSIRILNCSKWVSSILDLSTRRVTREGKEIDLTPTEFSLLEFLMRNAGQVLTRKMICEHLWEADWEGVTNVIEVHVTRLRAKIDRGFDEPLLHTVRGRGYVLRAA